MQQRSPLSHKERWATQGARVGNLPTNYLDYLFYEYCLYGTALIITTNCTHQQLQQLI